MRLVPASILAAALLAPASAQATCLALTDYPESRPLADVPLGPSGTEFMITYVHSVTRTPVHELYRVTGSEIVETQMRFEQYGPGLPTEADAGGSFTRRDGVFVVTMDRRLPAIVMQVHRDQAPRLVAGTQTFDLAQWGNRALALDVRAGPCAGP